MGTGSMTHNLAEFFGGGREPSPYVLEFSRWVESAVARGDRTALLNYRELAPHAQRAHPSEDHFLPVFFALGAAGWGGEVPFADRLHQPRGDVQHARDGRLCPVRPGKPSMSRNMNQNGTIPASDGHKLLSLLHRPPRPG
jgi:hypothetical protein